MKPRQWLFTIFLFIIYIAIFDLWRSMSGEWILVTGLVASAILSGTLLAIGGDSSLRMTFRSPGNSGTP